MVLSQTIDRMIEIGLVGMVEALREQQEQRHYLELSFEERLGMLVDREHDAREDRRMERRLRAAKLRQRATVEELDFRQPRGLDRSLTLSLAQAGWVEAHHNLLITGPTGVGTSSPAPWPTPPSAAATPPSTSAPPACSPTSPWPGATAAIPGCSPNWPRCRCSSSMTSY
jgi:IstB-like ATP binding protein